MKASTLRFLLSPAGQTLLAETAALHPTEATLLADLTLLRKRYPAEQAAAALETVLLRGRGAAKFSRAERMYFVSAALEQASGEEIAAYRARRYGAIGAEWVADLGCGIGGDSLALAAGSQVLGIDLDGLRLAMAQANCAVYDRGERFRPLLADLREWLPVGVGALFFDPGRRRDDGRRIHSVAHYRPPLASIQRWLPRVPHMAVKVSPGVDYDELPSGAEIEFISEKGTVKEAVLWFGGLRTSAGRRATLLPGRETLTDEPSPAIPVAPPSAYLYEPDGAVIRAHLVEQLAARLAAAKVDQDIAYLTADALVATPFARAYALEDQMPFNLKKLRAYLRARNVGRVVVKKRGSPLEPEGLIRRLRLRGEEERVLFLTRLDGRPSVLVGRPVAN
jgi:SAM-dependent methyltransferase